MTSGQRFLHLRGSNLIFQRAACVMGNVCRFPLAGVPENKGELRLNTLCPPQKPLYTSMRSSSPREDVYSRPSKSNPAGAMVDVDCIEARFRQRPISDAQRVTPDVFVDSASRTIPGGLSECEVHFAQNLRAESSATGTASHRRIHHPH